jgi:hypothetical protein
MTKAANTNCLTGMECPGCKSVGPFKIAATALFIIHDEGTGEFGELEYDDGSYCECPQCDFNGIVWDFKKGDHTFPRI